MQIRPRTGGNPFIHDAASKDDSAGESAGIPSDLETVDAIALRQLDAALSGNASFTDSARCALLSIAASQIAIRGRLEAIHLQLVQLERRT